MYLSRVEVDTANRAKTRDLTHLGAFHNWVEQSFPAEIAAGKRQRHLWRLDQLAGKRYLLVLSQDLPDPAGLLRYGVAGTVQSKAYDPLLARVQAGQLMRFRLTANPSYRMKRPGERQGRVVPHITAAQQRKWLEDRAEKAGFQLVDQQDVDDDAAFFEPAFDIVSRDWPVLHRKQGHGARLSRVTFEGVLRVTNATTFRQTLVTGLGREKAFGMGLLTVIPVD